MNRPAFVVAVLGLLVSAAPATAAPLGFTLDPDTAGMTWSIENQGLVGDLDGSGNDTYQILLTLTTTTSYSDSDAADLLAAFAVDFGVDSLDAATLVSGPAGYTWTQAPLNNKVPGGSAKCNGSEAGSLCLEETASPANNLAFDANATYSWIFYVDIGAGGFGDETTLTIAVATLKVTGSRSNPSYSWDGQSVVTGTAGSLALEEENGTPGPDPTPVPEPTTLVLLGTGLVIAANRMRRRE